LRAELEALVNKVPQAVNAGSIQTTRAWATDNKKTGSTAKSARSSRRILREALERAKGWHATEAA
jgi:hypothetical protein